MSHANARLTPTGRLLLVQRIEAGMPQAEVDRQMRLSRGTVAKWWHRWCEHGEAGLVDRSSRPHRSPRRTAAGVEQRICRLRRSTRRGPVYLSARTGVPAATVWRILARNGLNRLACITRPTGRVIRRYERSAPGESWCTSTSRRSQRSPQAAAGAYTGAAPSRPAAPSAARWATRICTSPSTTTPGSPTSRRMTTRPRPPSSGYGGVPRDGSGPTTWPWMR